MPFRVSRVVTLFLVVWRIVQTYILNCRGLATVSGFCRTVAPLTCDSTKATLNEAAEANRAVDSLSFRELSMLSSIGAGLLGGKCRYSHDFSISDHDTLDIHDILQGYSGGSLDAWVHLTASGKNTIVSVDADGSADASSFIVIATLMGFRPPRLLMPITCSRRGFCLSRDCK